MSELSKYLLGRKKKYMVDGQTDGLGAQGFREAIRKEVLADPQYFLKLNLDAVMEATAKAWQKPPRRLGPDLFSLAGYPIPEHLTRPANGYVSAEDIDNEDAFEKVDHQFATLQDFADDTTIKFRKGAEVVSAAERQAKAVDAGRKRARGDMTVLLRDIADALMPAVTQQQEPVA